MLRKHVRHVILSYYCPKDVALKLLSLCNSTVNLVITAGREREILPLLASLPLKRLGLGAWWIDNILHGTFTDPAFADIRIFTSTDLTPGRIRLGPSLYALRGSPIYPSRRIA
jgi:hypothetical protein